jgi:negative regulator of flagellin synthesis FlgM
MVEAVGSVPVPSSRGVSAVARIAVASGTPAAITTDENAATLTGVIGDAAAQAPIDTDRVASLRQQIASGSYTIDAAKIADNMLSLQREWTSDDQA